MALNRPAGMGEHENFQAVFEATLSPVASPLGDFSEGDFSSMEKPGIYRVVLPETGEHSYQFAITDGAFAWLPRVFLNFIHNWRSGAHENAWRGPATLDDGRRTDNGEQMDASGGWFDAGDSRKWMVHSNLAALAFMQAHDKIPWQYTDWERVEPGWSPWLLETRWGLEFILKIQNPADGMFYEDVGGGGNSRKRGNLSWWYENHSGCYADNADNRFTDNLPASGDERAVRIQYNPIVQFVNTTILACASQAYQEIDPLLASRCRRASLYGWQLGLSPDAKYLESPGTNYAAWTAVRSWRLEAALALFQAGQIPWADVEVGVQSLLENFDPELGFWRNETGGREPYQGILHSAQPIIALCKTLALPESAPLRDPVSAALGTALTRYIEPLSSLTPFRIMPFGVYAHPASEGDLYRP
jgi:hypothetical protein